MTRYFFTLLTISFLFFSACTTFSPLKRPLNSKHASNADSVLFYEQANLPNPFLDSLTSGLGNRIQLSATLFPPPPVVPKFKEIEGFRVQVSASTDSLKSIGLLNELSSFINDSIHLVKDKELFKVQVGDFPYRIEADSVVQVLRHHRIQGAWVVQGKILIPRSEANSPVIPEKPVQPADTLTLFSIQILATQDEANALAQVARLQQKVPWPVFYKQAGDLFKVFCGKFSSRNEADQALQKIKSIGLKDAWIVH